MRGCRFLTISRSVYTQQETGTKDKTLPPSMVVSLASLGGPLAASFAVSYGAQLQVSECRIRRTTFSHPIESLLSASRDASPSLARPSLVLTNDEYVFGLAYTTKRATPLRFILTYPLSGIC